MSQIGQGLQQFGQALSRMGEAHIKAQAEVELEQAANIIQERMNAFNRQLEMDGDWENYEVKWNKEQENLKKMLQEGRLVGVDSREMIFKTNLARRETESLLSRASVAQEARVLEKQQRHHMTHLAVSEEENLDRKIKAYTPETIDRAGGDIAKSAMFMMQYGLMDEAQAKNWTAAKADGAIGMATMNAARNAFNNVLAEGFSLEYAATYARAAVRENAPTLSIAGSTYTATEQHLNNADRAVESLYTQFDDEANQYFEIQYGNLLEGKPSGLTHDALDKAVMTWDSKNRWRQRLETHLNIRRRSGASDDTQADQILGLLYYAASQGELPGGTMLPIFAARWGADGTSFTRESLITAIDDVADIVNKSKGLAGMKPLAEIREMVSKNTVKTTENYADALIDRYIKDGKLTPEESVIVREHAHDFMRNHPGGQSSPEALRELEDNINKNISDNFDSMSVKAMRGLLSGDAAKITERFESDDIPVHKGRVLFFSREDQKIADEYAANAEREIKKATGWDAPLVNFQKGTGYIFTKVDGDKREVARFTRKYDKKNQILIEEYDGRILKRQYILADDGKKIDVEEKDGRYVSKASLEAQAAKNESERQKALKRREDAEKQRRREALESNMGRANIGGENMLSLVKEMQGLEQNVARMESAGGYSKEYIQRETERDRARIEEIRRKLQREPMYNEWKALGE